MTNGGSQPHSARFFIVGAFLTLILAVAIAVIGIYCAITIWQMAFVERRITKAEGVVGAVASLACVAFNISLLIASDTLTFPMFVASLFIMGNIAMTDRVFSEQRSRERMREIAPLIYAGKRPIEHSAISEAADRPGAQEKCEG